MHSLSSSSSAVLVLSEQGGREGKLGSTSWVSVVQDGALNQHLWRIVFSPSQGKEAGRVIGVKNI